MLLGVVLFSIHELVKCNISGGLKTVTFYLLCAFFVHTCQSAQSSSAHSVKITFMHRGFVLFPTFRFSPFYDLFTFTLPCFTYLLSPQWLRFRSTVQFQYNNLTLHIALVLVPTTRLCDLQCQRAYTILAWSSYLSRQLWATYDSEQNKYRCEAVLLRTYLSSNNSFSQQTPSHTFLSQGHARDIAS